PRAAAPRGGAAAAAGVGAGGATVAPRTRREPQELRGRKRPGRFPPIRRGLTFSAYSTATPDCTTVAPRATIVRLGALVTPDCTRTARRDRRVCDRVHGEHRSGYPARIERRVCDRCVADQAGAADAPRLRQGPFLDGGPSLRTSCLCIAPVIALPQESLP